MSQSYFLWRLVINVFSFPLSARAVNTHTPLHALFLKVMAEQRAFSCWLFPDNSVTENSMWKLGSPAGQKGGRILHFRPTKKAIESVSKGNSVMGRHIICFFPGEMRLKWSYGAGGIMKKGNGFCINCRADYLPFGIILSIRKLKNVGQSSFTIPPSLPSASFGLKWGAEVGLWLALPPASPYDAGLNASCKTHTRKSRNNSTLLLQKKNSLSRNYISGWFFSFSCQSFLNLLNLLKAGFS